MTMLKTVLKMPVSHLSCIIFTLTFPPIFVLYTSHTFLQNSNLKLKKIFVYKSIRNCLPDMSTICLANIGKDACDYYDYDEQDYYNGETLHSCGKNFTLTKY